MDKNSLGRIYVTCVMRMCVVGMFFYCVEMKNNGIFASSVRVAYNNKNKIQYFVYIHAMMTDLYEFVLYMYRVCV